MPGLLERIKRTISQIVIISIIASFFVAVPVARADVTSGLVGWWTMDESDISGATVYDKSGQNNNGTAIGTSNIAGQINQARDFNGTSDYINVNNSASLNLNSSNITLSAWIKPDSLPPSMHHRLLVKNETTGYMLNLYSTYFEIYIGGQNLGGGPATVGEWVHIVATAEVGGKIRMYKNGAKVSEQDYTGTINSAGGNLTLAAAAGGGSARLDGSLDDVRIYNRALSAAEITQLYNYNGTVHNLSNISDTLSDSDLSATATHTVSFTSNSSLAAGESASITWPSGFTGISNLTSSDLSASGMTIVSSCTASPNEMTASAVGQILTLTVCAGDTVTSGTKTITIGGTNKITNPSSAGSKEIRIDWDSDESGKTRVAIIDDVNITASMATAFTFTIAAKTSGTVNGESTSCEAGTTTTAIPFGTLTASNPKVACQTLSVATNAKNGFVVRVQQDQRLTSANGADIDTFKDDGQNSTPIDWVAPSDTLDSEATYGYMGVTSEDSDLNSDEFGSAKYAGNLLSARALFSHTGPANGSTANKGQTNVAYKVEIGSLQEAADDYSATLTYVATPTF
jgi:hypothetical protein